MITLLAFVGCASAQDSEPKQSAIAIEQQSEAEAAAQIEDAASPAIEESLAELRHTMEKLHGPEVVQQILAERERALAESAAEMAANEAEEEAAKEAAIADAVKEAKAKAPVLPDVGE